MINVTEIKKMNNGNPVLLCDLFDDSEITDHIKTEIGIFDRPEFAIGQVNECFSSPTTRMILLRTQRDCSGIKAIEFV